MSSNPAEKIVLNHPLTRVAAFIFARDKKKNGKPPEKEIERVIDSFEAVAIRQEQVINRDDIEDAFVSCISEMVNQFKGTKPRSIKEYRWAMLIDFF